MKLGMLRLNSPFVQAPMAGVTDSPFRTVAREFHDCLLFTEMISAEALSRRNPRTMTFLHGIDKQEPVGVQIAGHDPVRMAEAAEMAQEAGAALIDINAGCPQLKITRTGAGAALLKRPEHLAAILRAVETRVSIPVSVKLRLGWGQNDAVNICKMMESAGAAFVTLHGRTGQQRFTGKNDWQAIKDVVEELSIPVLANGDVGNEAEALGLLERTGAEGVMIGRAARGRPDLPGTAQSLLEDGSFQRMGRDVLASVIVRHARLEQELVGEEAGIRRMRKHVHWYLRAAGIGADAGEIYSMTTLEQLEGLVNRLIIAK